MFGKLFKKILGGGEEQTSPSARAQVDTPQPKLRNEGLVGFVEYAVRQLVDSPEEVAVLASDDDGQLNVKVTCAKADMGKVIGKRGRTVAAIRSLVTGAARRDGKRVKVDVVD